MHLFITSILRDIDINPVKDYQLKQISTLTSFYFHKKSVHVYLLIQTYIDQSFALQIIWLVSIWYDVLLCKGLWLCAREQALVKVPHETMKFLVIGVLENNTNSLKIMWRSLFLVKLHQKACNFTNNTRSLHMKACNFTNNTRSLHMKACNFTNNTRSLQNFSRFS